MKTDGSWVATGRLRVRETDVPLPGLAVELWDRDVMRDDPLGEVLTDKKGCFEIRYSTADFSDRGMEASPDLYVRVWLLERNRLLLDTREVVRQDATSREHFDLEISCWLFDKSDPHEFAMLRPWVRGVVYRTPEHTVLQNVTIRAVDAQTGKQYAESKTGFEGAYGLWFASNIPFGSKVIIEAHHKGRRVFASSPMGLRREQDLTFHIHVSDDDLANRS